MAKCMQKRLLKCTLQMLAEMHAEMYATHEERAISHRAKCSPGMHVKMIAEMHAEMYAKMQIPIPGELSLSLFLSSFTL